MGEFCELGCHSNLGTFRNHLSLSGQGRPFRLLTAARTSRDATREADKAVAAAIEESIVLTILRRKASLDLAKPASVAGQSRVLPGNINIF